MARLIDADAVIRQIDEMRPGRCYEDAWALTVMNSAPTVDAVPVVRCKDCKYGKKYNETQYQCDRLYGEWFEDDDFCSYGKRKGGDE